nr:hypothetical protein [Tanacetum cinerariifolium]
SAGSMTLHWPVPRTGGTVLQDSRFHRRRFTGLCIQDQASRFDYCKYLPSHEDLPTDLESSSHHIHSNLSV